MARVIQLFLFMSGVNTLLQTLAGTRLPTVMNASLAFVVPVLSIARQFDPNDFASNHQVPWLLISPNYHIWLELHAHPGSLLGFRIFWFG
jgi:hypothetical protein